MRKILTLFLLLATTALVSRADFRKVATFQDNYGTHEVGVTVTSDGSWYCLVDFDTDSDAQVSLVYSPGQIEALQQFFKDLKAKYLDWVKVARDNNVKKILKRVPLQSPTAVAMWVNSSGEVSYTTDTVVFEPLFQNSDDAGTKFQVFNAVGIEDKDNSSYRNTVHMNFQNAMQIQSLINALNPSRLREAAKRPAPRTSTPSSVDDLFK